MNIELTTPVQIQAQANKVIEKLTAAMPVSYFSEKKTFLETIGGSLQYCLDASKNCAGWEQKEYQGVIQGKLERLEELKAWADSF